MQPCRFPTLINITLYSLLAFTALLFHPNLSQSATVNLAWEAVSPAPDGYRIYQRVEGKSYDFSKPSWSGTKTTCSLTGLTDSTTYYFVVRAYDGSIESSNSNEVKLTGTTSSSGSSGSSGSTGSTSAGIIDDSSSNISSTGQWLVSGGSGSYGSKSLYSKTVGATYTFTSNVTGTHDVEIWWTQYASRCTKVPVKIYNGNTLLETVYVNQQQDGGRWNYLGTYNFSGQARIVITSQSSSCSTCADAVNLTKSTAVVSNDNDTSGSTTNTTTSGDTKVIDNGSTGTSASGQWSASGGTGSYGSGSVYSKTVGATYTFKSTITGAYDVEIWWTEYASRCTNVPIKIYDGDTLLETVYANQQKEGGRWNFLGTYDFTGQARVVVVSGNTGCSTCADAVKFSKSTNVVSSNNTKVLDNGGAGTSSTGQWLASGGSGFYGTNSLYSKNAGATYTFGSSVSGAYEIDLWWTGFASRCTNVPVRIYNGNTLLKTVTVNQQQNGGKWNNLGTYTFSGQGRVVVVSDNTSCSTCADAVRFLDN